MRHYRGLGLGEVSVRQSRDDSCVLIIGLVAARPDLETGIADDLDLIVQPGVPFPQGSMPGRTDEVIMEDPVLLMGCGMVAEISVLPEPADDLIARLELGDQCLCI